MELVTRRQRSAFASLILLFLIVAEACSSETNQRQPADAALALPEELDVQPSISLGCIGTATSGPPENFEVLLDAVALPTSPAHPALQTSRRQAADGSIYYFAKTGLVWNASSSFQLVVPERLQSQMAIGWGGGPASHGHSVEVSCDNGEGWVGLPGGYWVTEPLCADLIVRTETEEVTLQVGLGTPCDGQAPPQGPTDS